MKETAELVQKNKALELKISEFEKEFSELKNQDVTIRKLEDKIKEYENNMEEMVKKKTNETKQEISLETEKIISNYKEQEKTLTDQISSFKRENDELQNLYNSSQEEVLKTKGLMEKSNSSLQIQ